MEDSGKREGIVACVNQLRPSTNNEGLTMCTGSVVFFHRPQPQQNGEAVKTVGVTVDVEIGISVSTM